MKRYLVWLTVLITVICTLGYKPFKKVTAQQFESKSIMFEIYKGNNYAAEVYDGTSVQVTLLVEKVNKNGRTIVWDSSFDAVQIKHFPEENEALAKEVTIKDVFENKLALPTIFKKEIIIPNLMYDKQQLEVKYMLTYCTKGNKLSMQNEAIVSGDTQKIKISI